MSVDTATITTTRTDPVRTIRSLRLRIEPSDVLLPPAIALWSVGISQVDTRAMGGVGLIPALPVIYFIAIGVVVVSATLLLIAPAPSRTRLALHIGALIVMLYGTAPFVYAEPRYSWLYKHVGVVDYISVHHHLGKSIDIFHSWPGFFALAAWFGRVAGISGPLAVAAWSQLFFNLLVCLVLAFALRAFDLTWRERWLALMIFVGANWVAQDYFAPQAVGFVLSMGILAIAVHWCRDDRTAPWLRRLISRLRDFVGAPQPAPRPRPPRAERRRSRSVPVAPICALVLAYAALVITHELSPYVIVLQLGLLTLVGRLRPRWLAPLLLALALAYLAPRFGYVNQTYGLLDSLGQFFSNVRPPSVLGLHLSRDQLLVARASRALSILIWGFAAMGAYLRFRAGRPVLVLAVLAFSPFLLLGLQSYGGEAILRVQLFSLPWSACLAASALAPRKGGSRTRGWLLSCVALLVTVGLFLPSYLGSDSVNAMPPSAVRASRYLYAHGRPGGVIYLDKNFPISAGARYHIFDAVFILDSSTRPGAVFSALDVPALTSFAVETASAHKRAYLVLSRAMLTYGRAYGLTRSTSLRSLKDALDQSRDWRVFYRDHGTTIYELV